ncbi:lipocalin-like domain-containing protein [Bacteroidales bacterium OttesenSCG-928-M11]|nr:lipocalin-like domain-containing protein [Bacteroidales bacterium OttesenSCG-928-M11]
MKLKLFFPFTLLIVIIFSSCVDNDIPNMNGMWQLKTIENKDNLISKVDTIYYSFQRQRIFSYTVLTTNEIGQEQAWVAYGYVDYPSSEEMHIVIDEAFSNSTNSLLWKAMEVNYEIIHLSSKKMTLKYGEEIYSFIKF